MGSDRGVSGLAAWVLCACAIGWSATPAHAEAAGRVAATGLRVAAASDGEVTLTWPGSCLAPDSDFEVYEGLLGDPDSFAPVACTTGGSTTATVAPSSGARAFLVVPRNATHEGSYGENSAGIERPQSITACLPQEVGACPASSRLADLGSSPGSYRWMDAADQLYAASFRESYDYSQADVELQFFPRDTSFHGYVVAARLKPHFVYQVKLAGIPGSPSNEPIGLTGRWWQEEWNGSAWVNGQNLNNKGDGSSPNPNDDVYFSRRDIPDATSPTGRRYRYTGYLPFEYFTTDEAGSALLAFVQNSSYHVMWKTTQRAATAQDGPPKTASFDVALPDPVSAYDTDYPAASVTIFGEWERLPPGGVMLPAGIYEADFILTEESFHGSGLAGSWAAAVGASIVFEIEGAARRR